MISELMSGRCSDTRRHSLIEALDAATGRYSFAEAYFAAYYDERPVECWSASGFFPEKSAWLREVQLCWAAREVTLQLENGGLRQLLYNTHGVMLAEAEEWYRGNGGVEIADVLEKTRRLAGNGYRDRRVRIEMLNDSRSFAELERYQGSLDQLLMSEERFNSLCDDVFPRCGILRLARGR